MGSVDECYACHEADYEGAHNPFHPGVMPTTCGDCHEKTAWRPAHFPDHPFPLEGAHARTSCAEARCHGDPAVYEDLPEDSRLCVTCHREDYDGSTFAGHGTFPLECQSCHSQEAWQPAAFEHDFFPLTGAHAEATCASCHGDPPNDDLPTECVGCHRDDYDGSPYPGHQDFPTTCSDCHSTSAWTPATGGTHPEAAFPITRGAHGEIECRSCHNEALSASYVENVDCIGCHEHSQQHVNDQHREEGGYQYDPNDHDFCRDCHSSGRGG